MDFESLDILSSRFEDFMSLWFVPRNGEVVLDIGAHIGKYTIAAAKSVGQEGRVIALEPDKKNYATLCKNVVLNNVENIFALNLAAWMEEDSLVLQVGKTSGRHSVKRDLGLGHSAVRAVAIDGLVESNRMSRLDWVKVDVEGSETEALTGMQQTLRVLRPRIILEVTTSNLDSIRSILKIHEYQIIQISPLNVANRVQSSYFFAVPLGE